MKVNITSLKSKLVLITLILLPLISNAQQFTAKLIVEGNELNSIKNATQGLNKDESPYFDQTIKILHPKGYFFIIPFVSTRSGHEGCYVQTIDSHYKLLNRYIVESSEDAQTCEGIEAVYACKLKDVNGIGIISAVRLGSNHYYSSNSFFSVNDDYKLVENLKLTKLVNTIDKVAVAKSKLGCFHSNQWGQTRLISRY